MTRNRFLLKAIPRVAVEGALVIVVVIIVESVVIGLLRWIFGMPEVMLLPFPFVLLFDLAPWFVTAWFVKRRWSQLWAREGE